MVFSELYFVFGFFPLFFLCYYLFGKLFGLRGKNVTLFLFSLFFYAWGEPVYVLLMFYSTILDYTCGRIIEKGHNTENQRLKKTGLIISLVGNLGLLCTFKYLDLFIETLNYIPKVNLPLAEIALPIGISFYTFQTMSYSIDVYYGKVKAQHDIVTFGTYVTMFPQLIAGPVVRYSTVEAELMGRVENIDGFSNGLRRFIVGLGKKVIIANSMASIADGLYNPLNPAASTAHNISELGVIGSWVVIIAYTLHIYFDFSGYSDMAIGMGKMMGFKFLENFNYPYISKSITEFWRRWHISMSTFFRDYVYIPLGGSRCNTLKWIRNILIVWFATGLWHGANWTFVLWGLYFAAILLLEKFVLGKYLKKLPVINNIYALFLIVYGWVIFHMDNMTQIGEFTRTMFGGSGLLGDGKMNVLTLMSQAEIGTVSVAMFVIGAIASTPILGKLKKASEKSAVLPVLGDVALLAMFIICVAELATGSYNPFIYFAF
ncbi:MAG: MBOAT family protein [Ruminococcaceae bacterium]|nr:MBOAT family protein [Oscillospiraceae bacterium]